MTGEDLPDIKESGLGRFLIINLGRQSVPVTPALTQLQEAANDGYLRRAMSGYIAWLGGNDEKKENRLRAMFLENRTAAAEKIGEAGYRSVEAVAHLITALTTMAAYFAAVGAIEREQTAALIDLAWDVLVEVAQKQGKDVSEQKPTAQFLRIVGELLQSARFKCLAPDEQSNSINVLGYMDTNTYYFFPETLYQAVSKFCADQGTVFPVSLPQLRKQLVDEGKITADMASKSKRIRGRVTRYLWIPRALIDGDKEANEQQRMDFNRMTEVKNDEDNPFKS